MKKKWLVALLSLTMCMAFISCSSEENSTTSDSTPVSSIQSESDASSIPDSTPDSTPDDGGETPDDGEQTPEGPFVNIYLITFTDENGNVLQQGEYEEGEMPTPPQMQVPEDNDEYTYTGAWDKTITTVSEATTYKWVITATPRPSISVTEFTQPVSLVSKTVEAYMKSTPDVMLSEVRVTDELRADQGKALTISYETNNFPAGVTVQAATLVLSEDEGFINSESYHFSRTATSMDLYNLKQATKYYFRIDVTTSDGKLYSQAGQFETAEFPRFMFVDGIFNVRDIGGWKTTDGKVIRQGLLYRGTELDGIVEPTYKLTQPGLQTMQDVLKIQTDIDLRNPAAVGNPTQSPLGADVHYGIYNSVQYSAIFSSSGKETIRKIFSDLAKPEAYPVYLHCTYGCDRTGTVAMLLEGLLGVSEENVIRDYELSSTFMYHVVRTHYGSFMDDLLALEGATFQQKVEGYLLSAGVTAEEISTLKSIFLCDPTEETHTVSFIGADVMPQLVLNGGMVSRPSIPTKAHPDEDKLYLFEDWYTVDENGNIGEKWNFGTFITKDTVIAAVFTEIPSKYMITFKDTEGNVLQQTMVRYQELPQFTANYPTLPEADAEGSFMWLWDKEFSPVTEEAEYTLVLAHKYKVVFDGGDAVEYVHGAKVTPPTLEKREGFIFLYWELNGDPVDFNNFIVTESVEFISKWAEALTFDENLYGASISDPNGGVTNVDSLYEGGLRYTASTVETELLLYLPTINYAQYTSVSFDVKVCSYTFFGPDAAWRHYSTSDYTGELTIVYNGASILVTFAPTEGVAQKYTVTDAEIINGTKSLSCSVYTFTPFCYVEISMARLSRDVLPTAVGEDGTVVFAKDSNHFDGGLLYEIGQNKEQVWTINLNPFNYSACETITYNFQGTGSYMKIGFFDQINSGIRDNNTDALYGTMVFTRNEDGTFTIVITEKTTNRSITTTLTDSDIINGEVGFVFLVKCPKGRQFHISAPNTNAEGTDDDLPSTPISGANAVGDDGTVLKAVASNLFNDGLSFEIGNYTEQYWTATIDAFNYSAYDTITYEFQGTGSWMKICFVGESATGIRDDKVNSLNGTMTFTRNEDGSYTVTIYERTTNQTITSVVTDEKVLNGEVGYSFLIKGAKSRNFHISAPIVSES